MKIKRLFWFAGILVIGLGLSAYYSKKLKETLDPTPVVVVTAPATKPAVVASAQPVAKDNKLCEEQVEYKSWRRELGVQVNDHVTRQYKRNAFAMKIDKFRALHGIPLPLWVDAQEASKEKIVFNNCRPSCRGKVHSVFVSRVIDNKSVEVLNQKGKLIQIPLHKAGVEVLTIDELNKKGVPFRSWQVPVDSGPWYLKANNIYVGLDMEGVWLEVSEKGSWKVVLIDKAALKLNAVEPLNVAGCHRDENCLSDFNKKRFFKVPQACSPVVSH